MVRERAVRNRNPLGFAGRAGGIDHVRELLGVDAMVRIGDAFPRDLPPVCVEHHRLQRSAAEALRELLVGDYDRDRRIAQDVLEPLGRMARVERQIGGPRLEDSEQGNDELGRARQAQTDERLVCNPASGEVARKLIGPIIEFAVRQAAFSRLDGERVGR